MKFEETVQYFYDNYALVYRKRWQVLDHLFCVIGNGYEWENGELVQKEERDEHKTYRAELGSDGKAIMKKSVLEELYKKNYRTVIKQIEEEREELIEQGYSEEEAIAEWPMDQEEIWERVVKLTDKMGEREIGFYPLSPGTSRLFCIPDDIQPDWLEGVKETIQLILEHEDFTETEGKNEWQIEQMKEAKQQLDEISKKLSVL